MPLIWLNCFLIGMWLSFNNPDDLLPADFEVFIIINQELMKV